jgi:hypothetical protein
MEKNPTIVNFPVKGLDLAAYTDLAEKEKESAEASTRFNLMCSVQHDGPADGGAYRAFVHFQANDHWCAEITGDLVARRGGLLISARLTSDLGEVE